MNVRVVVLSVLVLAGIGVIYEQRSEPRFTVHAKPIENVDPEPGDFATGIEAALAAGRYDDLDAMEETYRSPDVRFVGGISKITRFYEVLAAFTPPGEPNQNPCDCTGSLVVTPSFTQIEVRLEAWHKGRPQSIAASLALAKIWLASAWQARGSKSADEVTSAQWQAVGERLSQAEFYLIDADPQVDPEVFYLQLKIGLLRGYGRSRLDDLYRRAIARFPTFYPYYGERAFELQTKWFGYDGELGHYLDDLRGADRGDTGQVAYQFATEQVMPRNGSDDPFAGAGLSFRAVINAYQTTEQRYGLRNRDWNAIFFLSIQGLDCETARVALQQIGDKWDPDVWGSRGYFKRTVAWFHAHSRY